MFTTNLGGRAPNARALFNNLYKKPIINANGAANLLNVTHQTSSALIRKLVAAGFLREMTGNQRNRNYLFAPYFELFID